MRRSRRSPCHFGLPRKCLLDLVVAGQASCRPRICDDQWCVDRPGRSALDVGDPSHQIDAVGRQIAGQAGEFNDVAFGERPEVWRNVRQRACG